MFGELTVLIRRDHDELDRTLAAMADPTLSPDHAVALLDAYRIGFTAHASAQTTVLPEVLGPVVTPQALAMIMQRIFEEHRDQALALAALASARPASSAWTTRVLALRVLLVDHASREELVPAPWSEYVPSEARLALASAYTSERLRRIPVVEALIERPRSQVWT